MTTEHGQAAPAASGGGTAVVHLAMSGPDGVSACGRWSKHVTSGTRRVTCPKCRETWDFALAEAKSGPAVDEAAFRRKLDKRAQEIAGKIDSAGLLSEGYRDVKW